MQLKLHQKDLKELVFEQDYPNDFETVDGGVIEQCYYIEKFFGVSSYREWYFEGVHIGYGNFHFKQPVTLYVESDIETVEMNFLLSGTNVVELNSFQMPDYHANQNSIFYSDGFDGNVHWKGGEPVCIFEVNLSTALFKRYLPVDEPYFEQFMKSMRQHQASIIHQQALPTTSAMLRLIHDIIHCQRQGIYKKLFLESKVLELLLLQLEQVQQAQGAALSQTLRPQHIEKIHAVQELLEKDLSQHQTLRQLAQAVQTNEHTLKRGFKAVYGMPIFAYWCKRRMEKAQDLLIKEGCTVKEVAQYLGYSEPHHFTTAFKRHFGVVPSRYKINGTAFSHLSSQPLPKLD